MRIIIKVKTVKQNGFEILYYDLGEENNMRYRTKYINKIIIIKYIIQQIEVPTYTG